MRRRGAAALGLVVLLVAGVLGACGAVTGEAEGGFGTPQVRALEPRALAARFAGEPVEVSARLGALPNGCLVAVVDGVEHLAFWPDGTEAVDSSDSPGDYTLRLPGGTVLRTSGTDGDAFTAVGVFDDGDGALAADPARPHDDYAGAYAGFCDVDAPAVAFRDAATFVVE
ncbi:hypothetical protein [Isoptericola variabilis]|uniref:Lipoprotein n=1 Tax=Isoptericola variabilis (strain 225) TaxID=743718 RepID=F6FV72_ISOV2|nr:hypothetical protein [Isoptericola variabilis]AEG45500.1 hypothetical protein Isova_2811 [Isoptericola variabilis 225]TWH33812.1 hypothetical protein L600_001500000230 [Isoptericola variabilis J7]